MKYNEYMDEVEFKGPRLNGSVLEKQLSKTSFISLNWLELDTPKLYVLKANKEDEYHIIPLTGEVMIDLIKSYE